MDKIKITKKQKNILMIVGIIVSAFIVFIVLIYIPLKSQLIRVKKEYYDIESEIKTIKNIAGKDKPLEEAIGLFKTKLDTLEKQFPEKEEIILRELSGLAGRLDIEVVSIKPERKRVIRDLNGIPLSIKGCYVEEMSVSMSLKAPYKTMGQFFKNLYEDFPIFVKIENINITKVGDKEKTHLDVELSLSTYLICPES